MKKSILCCIVCITLVLAIGLTFVACGSNAKNKTYKITTQCETPDAGTYTQLNEEVKNKGESVSLTVFPYAGYSFLGWFSGDTLVSEELTYTFEMPAKNLIYTAKFGKQSYALTTQANLVGAGTFTEIDHQTYVFESEVSLAATVNEGYTFLGWFDGASLLSSELSFTGTMPAKDAIFMAKYEKNTYTITTEINIPDAGTCTRYNGGNKTFEESVSLTASPSDEYVFVGWFDGETLLSEEASYTFEMPSKNVRYTAVFDKEAGWKFSTAVNNDTAGGCTRYVDITVKTGTEINLTATAFMGCTFLGWYDGDKLLSEEPEFALLMPRKDTVCTACFAAYTLSTDLNIENAGSYSQRYGLRTSAGTEVSLSARPYYGYLWQGWYNGEKLMSEDMDYTFDMPASDVLYTATFKVCEHEKLNGCLCSLCGAIAHDYANGSCMRCGSHVIQRVDADGNEAENGDYLLFGTYLQSKVTDAELCDELTSRAGLLPYGTNYYSWTKEENKNRFYIDFNYSEDIYRGIYENGVTTWYKYEPIKWRIMSEENGTAFVICENVLDTVAYDAGGENDYGESEVRAYLNGNFLNRAFTAAQQNLVLSTTVDNSLETTGYAENPYVCADTNDKVFLLSYVEVMNPMYGFNDDADRKRKVTDYSYYVNNVMRENDDGYWWIRSPHNLYLGCVRCINARGALSYDDVRLPSYGIVPALNISLY